MDPRIRLRSKASGNDRILWRGKKKDKEKYFEGIRSVVGVIFNNPLILK